MKETEMLVMCELLDGVLREYSENPTEIPQSLRAIGAKECREQSDKLREAIDARCKELESEG